MKLDVIGEDVYDIKIKGYLEKVKVVEAISV